MSDASISRTSGSASPSANPYVGPRSFNREDASRFFGRDTEARDLHQLAGTEQVIVLHGASGVGKSSLVFTRLVQSLEEDEGFAVSGVGRVSGRLPAGVDVENIFVYSLLLSLSSLESDPTALALTSLGQLIQRPREDDKRPGGAVDRPVVRVLIIDQFEEIFTTSQERWQDQEPFFRQLGQALSDDPFLSVILCLREDYLAQLEAFDHLIPGRFRSRYRLEPLRADAALEAVRRPAEQAGRPFEVGVAEQLVDSLRQIAAHSQAGTVSGRYVEALQLQVVCYQLWEHLKDRPPGSITVDDLQAAGDVDRALTEFYQDTVAAVLADAAATVTERQLRRWFDEVLITSNGTRNIVFQGKDDTAGMPNRVVRLLQQRYLVRAEQRGGGTWIELAHDRMIAVIRADNAAWFVASQSTLQRQASLWQEQDRSDDLLLRGEALAEAERWAQSQADMLTPLEREFLEACREARKQVERENRQARRIRALAVASVIVALVAMIAAAFGVSGQKNATLAAQRASTAEYSAKLAQKTAEAEAFNARTAEAAAYALLNLLTTTTPTPAVSAAATLPPATRIATPTPATGRTSVTERSTTPTITATRLPSATATATAASDLSFTATAAAMQTISAVQTQLALSAVQQQAVETATSMPTVTPTPAPNRTVIALQTQQARVGATQTVVAVGVPPGRIIFASNRSSRNDLYRVDPTTAEFIRLTQKGGIQPSHSANFSPDSRRIVYASEQTGAASLYEVDRRGGTEKQIDTQGRVAWQPSLSPTGSGTTEAVSVAFVSNTGEDSNIYRVNLDGSGLQQLTSHPAKDDSPAWSPDGRYIAFVSDRDGQPEIYRMRADGSEAVRLTRNPGIDTEPAWSPDSQQISFTTKRDGLSEIYVMDLDGGNQRNITQSPFDEDYSTWSPDGQWLAFSRYTTNNEIFVIHLKTRVIVNITNHSGSDFDPIWIP